MMEFTEAFTLEMPRIDHSELAEFASGDDLKKGLIVEIAAIHAGMTKNFNLYTAEELRTSVETWTSPYNRPIIINHDVYTEPLGRVLGAKMDQEPDGSEFIRIQAGILDPNAAQKVMDKRYLTGSVGGSCESALCTLCGTDWAAERDKPGMPCNHRRGTVYKGKLASLEMRGISWREYSFVNVPADSTSGVRAMASAEGINEGWDSKAHFFAVDMAKQEVFQLGEAHNVNILDGLKKKEASSAYLTLKGGFLTALAEFQTSTTDNEENSMATKDLTNEDEDILAVAEGLSADLAAGEPVEGADENVVEQEEDNTELEEEGEPKEADADEATESEETVEAEEGAEAPEAEEDKPEAQERPHDKDVDPDTSDGAPISREGDETEDQEEVEEPEADTTPEKSDAPAEYTEAIAAFESRIAELEAETSKLSEDNVRLKTAVKRGLAERVVDTKISLGMSEAEKRAELLEEHMSRSASSLADFLRDFSGDSVSPRGGNAIESREVPKIEENVVVADADLLTNTHSDGSTVATEDTAEDLFVDAFMGRRPL